MFKLKNKFFPVVGEIKGDFQNLRKRHTISEFKYSPKMSRSVHCMSKVGAPIQHTHTHTHTHTNAVYKSIKAKVAIHPLKNVIMTH